MYVLQLLRFLGHDIACPIGYLIDCSAVEELSKRNSEPPGARAFPLLVSPHPFEKATVQSLRVVRRSLQRGESVLGNLQFSISKRRPRQPPARGSRLIAVTARPPRGGDAQTAHGHRLP